MRPIAVVALVLVCTGCQTLGIGPKPPAPAAPPVIEAGPVAADYAVCFPDMLELEVAGRPDCSGPRLVYPDGRLDLGAHGPVFAEGCTTAELTRRVADAIGVSAQQVRCRVSVARSRVVYLVGTGAVQPRSIPYRGPERATDLLRQAGGLPADSDPDVQVVRRNVARGTPTETFRVNLAAVRKGDRQTDVVLQPNDEVHVAEDAGLRLAAFVPDWVRP